MKKTVFIFSTLIVALLLLFKLSEYAVLFRHTKAELVIGLIAVLFFVIGIYINKRSLHRQQKTESFIDHKKIEVLGISKREYEILCEVANGLSNREIAEKLFIAESTVKTHVSNLLLKLDVKRRTQAIQKAKELHILPV
ncbi:MAG: LuxR C-terminal-related transcriptional regulator [Bacteroidota bacterium]